LAVIKTFGDLGAGADVVSEGELHRALAAGIPADRVIFSGVGKSREELASAVEHGILQVNVESLPELEALSEVAAARNATMDIAIRVNPDVDAKTHEKLTTGRQEDKFGIDIEHAPAAYAQAAALAGLNPVSVAVHIGSQLVDLRPFRAAFKRVAKLVRQLRESGHDIQRIDLGGGLGIPYRDETPPHPDAYAAMVRETVGDLGCKLAFEPGRMLVGNAGVLVGKVLYVKQGQAHRFVILDAAMNDLIRPSFYEAYHEILPIRQPAADAPLDHAEVVGPICEPGDTFARNRPLPPIVTGDLLAFSTAGAYGAVMASTYNSRPLVPEVMVNGDAFSVVRERQSYEAMLAAESLADWQLDGPVRRQGTG
ncbi:MAG: diaminopimelate decarboxylase, partial [Alphaproteobacteria bacterium]|nr:diaminopimelate decarboxylase [Alphaproteobacteria bacterium]